jgi:hypothetical protein
MNKANICLLCYFYYGYIGPKTGPPWKTTPYPRYGLGYTIFLENAFLSVKNLRFWEILASLNYAKLFWLIMREQK